MTDLSKLCSVVGTGLTIKQVKLGLGLTITQVKLSNLVPMLKFTQFAIFVNGLGMCFMKVGIGLSLLRLSLSKRFNWAVLACIVLSMCVNLIVFPGVFAQCRPVNKLWNTALKGTCWPKDASLAFSYTQTGTSTWIFAYFSADTSQLEMSSPTLPSPSGRCSILLKSRYRVTTSGHFEGSS
jgi:hypothetical protein